ncbi:MAG: hypothetical protein A2W23_00010 [Planctomycetes bacterium RBG_16_43_13]|nr:MAG: hypothetical protein A2W23_00010 [Planctomycetes bacterium RBG_16_43_13]
MGWGITADSSGNAYIAGETESTNFPTASPIQASNAGVKDAFVTKINAAGSAFIYSTYLGGSGTDYAWDIAIDSSESAYVIGRTNSTNFPTVSPIQASNAGGYDAFVAKISSFMGDINKDGIVDILDVILEVRMALKLDPVQPCSDINNDGIVDILDVILTVRMALGLDPLQQCI